MARRFQFSLRWLFMAMLAAACFFGGIRFERERQRRQDDELTFVSIAAIDPCYADSASALLKSNGIAFNIDRSIPYGVSVPPSQKVRAVSLLRADAAATRYWVKFK